MIEKSVKNFKRLQSCCFYKCDESMSESCYISLLFTRGLGGGGKKEKVGRVRLGYSGGCEMI